MELKQRITSSRYSIKDFSKHIAMFLGKEWDEAYYQRIRDILGDERSTVTQKELQAFDWWEYTFDNPFEASYSGWVMRNQGKALDQIWKFLRTGNYHPKQAKRLIKQLKEAIP